MIQLFCSDPIPMAFYEHMPSYKAVREKECPHCVEEAHEKAFKLGEEANSLCVQIAILNDGDPEKDRLEAKWREVYGEHVKAGLYTLYYLPTQGHA